MSYDPADNSAKSYALAIDTMREKLESFHRVQIGDCTLYRADCREVLPLLPKVDAVVTDPPYGIDFTQRTTGAKIIGDDVEFDPRPFIELAPQCLLWGADNYRNLPIGRWLVWIKRAVEVAAPKSYGDCELAWLSTKGCITAIRQISDGCIRQGAEHGIVRLHPSQKPIAVMAWCLGFIEGDTILDPFMGSGTTGVACVKLGRKFIGIEIDQKYFEIACKRIQAAYDQPDMFIEVEKQKAEQLNLLEAESI